MSEMNDDQSELLDADVLPEEFPPERPYAVDDPLTPTEEQTDEPIAERVKRERPDHLGTDQGRVGGLVAPGGDQGLDEEKDAVATEIGPDVRRDQLDPGDISFGDETRRDAATEKEEVISAEEAAMHETEPPPMGDGDGYLD